MIRNNKIDLAGLPEIREIYETPVIEMVEVRVEQGFQSSPLSPDDDKDPDKFTW